MTRITLTLTNEEKAALQRMAQAQLRQPRDQARVILRDALGLQGGPAKFQEKHNGGATVSQAQRAAVAA